MIAVLISRSPRNLASAADDAIVGTLERLSKIISLLCFVQMCRHRRPANNLFRELPRLCSECVLVQEERGKWCLYKAKGARRYRFFSSLQAVDAKATCNFRNGDALRSFGENCRFRRPGLGIGWRQQCCFRPAKFKLWRRSPLP